MAKADIRIGERFEMPKFAATAKNSLGGGQHARS
jgi:hypothetical protein